MINTTTIFNQFGNNPFAKDLENLIIIESTRPYKKGENLVSNNLNFVCQADIAARVKVLLVLDGLIAIPETITKTKEINERLVLDRRLILEDTLQLQIDSKIWGLDTIATNNNFKPYYYLFNPRRKVLEAVSLSEAGFFDFIYVDPLDRNSLVKILDVRIEPTQVKFTFLNGARKKEVIFPRFFISIFNFSMCNGWFWNPGQREDNGINPDYLSGKVVDFSRGIVTDSMSLTCTGNFGLSDPTSPVFGGPGLTTQVGTMRHLPDSKDLPVSYVFDRVNNVGSNTERTTTATYSKPKLADLRTRRVIAYDVENVESFSRSYLLGSPNRPSDEDITLTNFANAEGYLYDYSSDLQNPTKTKINTSGPHSISLYLNSGAGFTGDYQSDYEVNDVLTFTFPANFQGHGNTPINGSRLLNTYSGSIDTTKRNEWLESLITPIENAYAWLPCTGGLNEYVGAKGIITSITTDSTTLARQGLDSLISANPDIYRAVTFEITSIEIPKTNINKTGTNAGAYFPDIFVNSSTSGNRTGWIKFGKSFQNLNVDPIDQPLNYLLTRQRDIGDAFVGIYLSQDGQANRYWWEGNKIWHLPLYDTLGQELFQIYSTSSKIHIPRFRMEFNSTKNWYDFVFETWDEFDTKGIPGSSIVPADLRLNDIAIRPVSMVNAARGLS
jgi:hypothetical protein